MIVLLIVLGILILAFLFVKLFGINLGKQCRYYNFAAPYTDSCKCIGIQKGGCPANAYSCDKEITRCLGIRIECYRTYPENQTKMIIPCQQ